MRAVLISLFFLTLFSVQAQLNISFDGQVSGFSSYHFNEDRSFLLGTRYIPELNVKYNLDSFSSIDLEASSNLSTFLLSDIDEVELSFDWTSYRFWTRYATKQWEIRLGLQKIEFGSAALLRPLQWFNRLDPRDPLQLTTGVNALLGRYYFKNNANIWVWGLYGNEDLKTYEITPSITTIPEYGFRVQLPVTKGEVGLTAHRRISDVASITNMLDYRSAENRVGLDGKWDVGVGLWFEVSHNWYDKVVGPFRHANFATLGMDYTFGLGNGLNVIGEFMFVQFSEEWIDDSKPTQLVAIMMAYPITLFDRISLVSTYNIVPNQGSFFINYEHQFKVFSGYLMLFYNPENSNVITQNGFDQNFSGPGARIMFVFNH